MRTTAMILKGKSNYTTVGEMKANYITKPNIKMSELPKVTGAGEAFNIIQPFYAESINHVESFGLIFMNRALKVLATAILFEGGTTGCTIDPKVIFQHALLFNASSIILCHNHPSGSILPSESDKNLTQKVKSAGKMLDISVVDHLVITESGYFSFADEGLL